MALLLLSVVAIAARRLKCWREILFLVIPPAFYLIVAFTVGMNIGVRHILPVYVFLSVLIGGAAWALVRQNRRWAYLCGVTADTCDFFVADISGLHCLCK